MFYCSSNSSVMNFKRVTKGDPLSIKEDIYYPFFYKPTVTRCNPCNLDQKGQKFSISDVILCAALNAVIKKIEQRKCGIIMTSFLIVNRGKTVTQQCNSLVKRYRSLFFIVF